MENACLARNLQDCDQPGCYCRSNGRESASTAHSAAKPQILATPCLWGNKDTFTGLGFFLLKSTPQATEVSHARLACWDQLGNPSMATAEISGLPSLRCLLPCAHTCEFRECLLMTGLRVSSVLLPGIFFWFEALEPGKRITFYHLRDTLWAIHQEFRNIQWTDILRANKLSGLVSGLREAKIKKIRASFSFYYPPDQRNGLGTWCKAGSVRRAGCGSCLCQVITEQSLMVVEPQFPHL